MAYTKGDCQEVDDSWTTTTSGLKYQDVQVGSGDAVSKGTIVKMDYTGWLEATGREFDSSAGRAPLSFSLGAGRVIPGWDEGLDGMKVGGKRRLSIPPSLAYGDEGAGAEPLVV